MNINIFGSTGIIGSKTLNMLTNYFPSIKINLLCANNNVSKIIKQSHLHKPKYIYLNNENKIKYLKKNIYHSTKILNFDDLKAYLSGSRSDYSILAVSGYKSLQYFDLIIKNTDSLGLVNKEAIVSAGHIFSKYNNKLKAKIFPLDSEHFSIFKNKNIYNFKNIKKFILTASGGPFLGKSFNSLKKISFKKASTHPKWKMGYKNSIDSATLVNKCLELIEAHYLFDIPFNKLDIIIHPQSQIHSIIEYNNYFYNMNVFQNDMMIPIYHFLNQKFNQNLSKKSLEMNINQNYTFSKVKNSQFPILKLFEELDKSKPINLIKFNVANEYAVNLFKNNLICYTDIYRIIDKITSLNLNYKLNTIKEVMEYHELLERKINTYFNYNN